MKSPPHLAPAAAGATTNYQFEQRWRLGSGGDVRVRISI